MKSGIQISPHIDPSPVPKGERRSTNKARRQAALLGSARRLIEESGTTGFTMQQLAQRSDLAVASIYSLVGNKASVLYALLDERLDDLAKAQQQMRTQGEAPRLADMIGLAVDFFTGEERYHRPLMRYLLGVYEPEKRPLFMSKAREYWRLSAQPSAEDADRLLTAHRFEDLAQGIHLAFTGALDLWVHAEISSTEFRKVMIRQGELLLAATGWPIDHLSGNAQNGGCKACLN